jgi:DNA adenine methylase
MIKSPLRYPGGKSRAVKKISALVPEFIEFREPFVGGGSIFVYLKQKYPEKNFWINDLYENLYHFWNNCKKNPEELIKQINLWKNKYSNGKELHKYLLNNIDNFDEANKAAAFFIFNRITFSGTTESGGYSNAAFKGRFTNSSIERVKQLSTILAKTKITNIDYQKVVEKPGKNVFIFLDPPYYSATNSALYGKNGNFHKSFDHIRFAEVMKNCNHKWLLTYDNSKYIKELFSFANIFEWDLTYGMRNVSENSNQNEKELFISNFLDYSLNSEQLNVFDIIDNSTIIKYTDNKPIHA